MRVLKSERSGNGSAGVGVTVAVGVAVRVGVGVGVAAKYATFHSTAPTSTVLLVEHWVPCTRHSTPEPSALVRRLASQVNATTSPVVLDTVVDAPAVPRRTPFSNRLR